MQNQEKHSQAAILGLQHLLAMYSGSILVPIVIHGALAIQLEQLTYLISTDIFMWWGGHLPPTPTQQILRDWTTSRSRGCLPSVAPLIMIGQSHGSGGYVWCPYRFWDLCGS